MLIRIATRRSKLALVQSCWVKERLEALDKGLTVELREYVTQGDQILNLPLAEFGGKGVFTREIEEALLAGEVDLAVHSLKDLPAELPAGLILTAVPKREDPTDALVLAPLVHRKPVAARLAGTTERFTVAPEHLNTRTPERLLDVLPSGALVGSSSLRRSAQIRHLRPDLRVESVRGNVDTRLRKLDEGQYDALILASAGLRRLGLTSRISASLPVEICTPAPGQGALGLEARRGDASITDLLARLNHPPTRGAVTAERAVMETLGGGCSLPLGAYGRVEGDTLFLSAVVAAPDGSVVVRRDGSGPAADPGGLGRRIGEMLLSAGARGLLEQ